MFQASAGCGRACTEAVLAARLHPRPRLPSAAARYKTPTPAGGIPPNLLRLGFRVLLASLDPSFKLAGTPTILPNEQPEVTHFEASGKAPGVSGGVLDLPADLRNQKICIEKILVTLILENSDFKASRCPKAARGPLAPRRASPLKLLGSLGPPPRRGGGSRVRHKLTCKQAKLTRKAQALKTVRSGRLRVRHTLTRKGWPRRGAYAQATSLREAAGNNGHRVFAISRRRVHVTAAAAKERR
jgi:hypothetical protein